MSHTHMTTILHSILAANSLQRPSSELEYLRMNFILRLETNSFVYQLCQRSNDTLW